MTPTQRLHQLGQSLWLDNITRGLLDDGTIERYIKEDSVTGLTSNPTIFQKGIGGSGDYDDAIRKLAASGKHDEDLFFELALQDLTRAAKLFRPIHDRTNGGDGYVSLEVSPLLAHDTKRTMEAAKTLHAKANCPNLMIKIPGTKEGLAAIEETIFAGIPVNITLLFSDTQYLAAADAYMRGIERRIEAGLPADIRSVASIFVSRWDAAIVKTAPKELHNRLGIAVGKRAYRGYIDMLSSPRWMRAYNAGARPQRLLWASTGTKDPAMPDDLYVKALAAPFTVNTMPDKTLKAFAKTGEIGSPLPMDGGDCERDLADFVRAGVDVDALAAKLQEDGAKSFVDSWTDLLKTISSKTDALKKAS